MKALLRWPWEASQRLAGNKRLIRLVRLTGMMLTAVSIILVLRQVTFDLSSGLQFNALPEVALAFALYGASFGVQGLAWCLLIRGLSHTRTGWRDLEIWAYSNLMRRTPGVIWYLIERVESYREGGMAASVTLTAAGAEWVLLIMASVAVFAATFAPLGPWVAPILIAAAVASATLLARTMRITTGRAATSGAPPENLGVPAFRTRSVWLHLGLVFLMYSGCYLFGGAIIMLLLGIADPWRPLSIVDAVNLWAVTGGMGFLASVIIPVNVGVREVTLAVTLLPFTTAEAAITVAAMVRVLFILADVAYSIGLWRVARWFRQRSPVSERTG